MADRTRFGNIVYALAGLALLPYSANACTLIAVGKNATTDGSVMVAHTDDGGGGAADLRLVRVPAMDYPAGAMRPVHMFAGGFPRLVTADRGDGYMPRPGGVDQVFKPLGFIPQVPHTFAYWDQDYGLINEHQLIIGESTAPSRTAGWPLTTPTVGHCLFGIDELTKVAMERCDTARCAVKLMGDLAVQYGFWSADSGDPLSPVYADTAEVLAVGDKIGEVWLFHVITGKNNASAVWVAQRVPDDHIAALPNTMTIRQVDLSDPNNFMASPDVESLAVEMGWYNPQTDGAFDWLRAYGNPTGMSPVSPLYSGRRMWRIYQLLAPSQDLDPDLGVVPGRPSYPTTIAPDQKLSPSDIFKVYRDHYEGTKFDMTQGLGAGPFGNPTRFDGGPQSDGAGWEREMSLFRTTFSFVAQARANFPDLVGGVVWFGYGSAHGTVYVPFYGGQDAFAPSYTTQAGMQSSFDITNLALAGAWRVFNLVNNWRMLKFSYMTKDIEDVRNVLEAESVDIAVRAEATALGLISSDVAAAKLALQRTTIAHANLVVAAWWELAGTLIAKFSDGYITTGETADDQLTPGYPDDWLAQTEWNGWPHGAWKPPAAHAQNLFVLDTLPVARAGHSGLAWPLVGLSVVMNVVFLILLKFRLCKCRQAEYIRLP